MDDMGSTLLYIIGGILYLLFSFRRTGKKPSQRPVHRIPPESPAEAETDAGSVPGGFSLPDFFPMPDADLPSEPEPFLSDVFEAETDAGTVLNPEVLSSGTASDALPPSDGVSTAEKMPEDSDSSDSSGILKDFDLQRAVLYSEILRPKFND